MEVLEQSNDWNCGVYCVHFLLGLHGVKVDPEILEAIMATTPADGTSHKNIMMGLSHFGFKWVSWYDSHVSTLQEFLPAIINYQYCDEDGCDGHYAVVLGQGHGFFVIYNPATGEIEKLDSGYLEKNWYSERYGKGWFLQPVKNDNHGLESER
jgi:ABC-type bacteriocin/lantibiotic exporter with double-glycine peptidase domain